jgi:signal peptidase II
VDRDPTSLSAESPPLAGRAGFAVIAVLGVILDLWSKWAVFAALGHPDEQRVLGVVPGILSFRTALNPGGAWSLLQQVPQFFLVVRTVAIGVVVYLFLHTDPRRRLFLWGLGFVLAGAAGNLWDQLAHDAVRDFIRLDFINFPIFNLADTWINVGAGLILLQWFLDGRRARAAARRERPLVEGGRD